jgi:hypothetical protein
MLKVFQVELGLPKKEDVFHSISLVAGGIGGLSIKRPPNANAIDPGSGAINPGAVKVPLPESV